MTVAHVNLARGFRGGERQTELLIRELASRGVAQRLVARRGGRLDARCAGIDGLDVRAVSNNALSAAVALKGVQLVHVHEARSLTAAFINRKLRGTPYVVTRRVQKGPSASWLNRSMYAKASAVAGLSTAIVAALQRLVPDLDVTVIPSSASALAFNKTVAARLRDDFGGEFVVGHVGALDDSHKGQRQIFAVAERAMQDLPGLRFVLVGSGRDEPQFRAEAGRLNNVIMVGQVDNVGDYLAAFDAFIFPSRHEGLGSILLDALSFGLPIVASNVGGIPEVVEDQINGFLCPVDDIDAFHTAIVALHEKPERYRQMVEKNRQTAENYSSSTMADRYQRLYAAIVAG